MRGRNRRGNVFVANLPPDFSDEQLAAVFDAFGIVLSAHVARDPTNGKRLRYGFVDIATERAAQAAIAGLNGTEIDGHALDVRISEQPAASAKRSPAATSPRQPSARLTNAPRAPLEDAASEEPGFGSYTPRRKPASFVVERRSLPRRG